MLRRMYAGKGLIIALVVGFLAVEAIVAACFLSFMHVKTSRTFFEIVFGRINSKEVFLLFF